MSFQGDVGGIGLAELLQSLARGRREGVLRMHTACGLSGRVGLCDGVVHFLPEEDEDSQLWKDRARQAWIADQDYRIDAVRMSDIAHAHRIERLYGILDSEGVHFRFEPGPLPARPTDAVQESEGDTKANQARMPQVFCEPMAVEFLLLEYARMTDEFEGLGGHWWFTDYAMPRLIARERGTEPLSRALQECDGISTLSEIADRLGWPIRQARLTFAGLLKAGEVRFAQHRELLVLAQKELAKGHVSRASARLVGWVQTSPPGPNEEGDAQLLAAEFKAERMAVILNMMPTREARTMLRRLDHGFGDPAAAVKHWRELGRLKRHDPIIEIHRLACEYRWEEDEETPSLRELLDMARELREKDHPGRAGAFLRLAAARNPASISARLEIGLGFLSANLIEEGAAWIIDGAQMLIASGSPQKAIAPLRTLVEADPSIREARRMLGRLRHLTLRRRLIRKHSLVGMAIVASVGLGALVQVRSEKNTSLQLAEIAEQISNPARAQALLEEYFPGDDSAKVEKLRDAIGERRKAVEGESRNAWYEKYKVAQLACSLGDAADGLRLALELPAPPRLTTVNEPWPLVTDLFNGLAARLEKEFYSLKEVELDFPEQVRSEETLRETVEKLNAELEKLPEERVNSDLGDLSERLEKIATEIESRTRDRNEQIDERNRQDTLARQDLMLAAARAHAEADDLERSITVYELLIESDESGRLETILEEEFGEVRRCWSAIGRARELAGKGRHAEAREVLDAELEDANAQTLPWTLETFPVGAMAHLVDGSTRITPFVVESRVGEQIEFILEYEGCANSTLQVDEPMNRIVFLSRLPERQWRSGGRVDALPVAVADSHIVCDRTGRLARVRGGGKPTWESKLSSLGGIARAPVFLPRKPGFLLLLTEDGEAWMVDAENGEYEGPWSLGSPPTEGPSPTAEGVQARLKDGRILTWTTQVRPKEEQHGKLGPEVKLGTTAGMHVLHRSEGGRRILESPWTDWRVEIEEEIFRVIDGDSEEGSFAVERGGKWSFLAWEAPFARLPKGRLWISDSEGLRAFTP
jgi:hypothetical protein